MGSAREEKRESESHPKPRPKPKPSSAPQMSRKEVCVYYCSTYYKAVRGRGIVEDICVSACRCVFITEGDSGGHVLRETTSRGPCELVCLVVVVYYCST